jgi:hypothetical protein
MYYFILNLLGINKLAFLRNRSSNVFNVFTKTINKLSTLNAYIENEQKNRLAKIAKAQEEHESLTAQRGSNQKVIDKINEFIK